MRTARAYAWSQRHPVLVDALLAAALFLTVGLLSAVVAGWTPLAGGRLRLDRRGVVAPARRPQSAAAR